MFDIGFWEISLIFIIALLVVGPERLPRVARDVGLWVGKVRRYVAHVRSDIEREINAQEVRDMLEKPKELNDLYDVVEETKGTLKAAKDTLNDARSEADSWTKSIDKPADGDGGKAPAKAAAASDEAPTKIGSEPDSTDAKPVPDKPGAASNGQGAATPEQSATAQQGADSAPPRETTP